jgi:hypothetical protein
VAIYRLLQEAKLSDADAKTVAVAYEIALASLHLKDRTDPVTELVATKIIQVFQAGEYRPTKVADRAIRELGVPLDGNPK